MLRDYKSSILSVIMRNESLWFEVKIKIGEGFYFNFVCVLCYRFTCERKKYVYGLSYRYKLLSCEGVNFDIIGFYICSFLKKFFMYIYVCFCYKFILG